MSFSQNKTPSSPLDGLGEERSCSPEQQIAQWLFLSQWKSQYLGFFKLSVSSPVSAVACFGHHCWASRSCSTSFRLDHAGVYRNEGRFKVKSQHEWSILAVGKSPSDGMWFPKECRIDPCTFQDSDWEQTGSVLLLQSSGTHRGWRAQEAWEHMGMAGHSAAMWQAQQHLGVRTFFRRGSFIVRGKIIVGFF